MMIVSYRAKYRLSNRLLGLERNFAFAEETLKLKEGDVTGNATIANGGSEVFNLDHEELA